MSGYVEGHMVVTTERCWGCNRRRASTRAMWCAFVAWLTGTRVYWGEGEYLCSHDDCAANRIARVPVGGSLP